MTEPHFDIDRIKDDLNQRKARTPNVLTPGRHRRGTFLRLDYPTWGLHVVNLVTFFAGVLVGGWLW